MILIISLIIKLNIHAVAKQINKPKPISKSPIPKQTSFWPIPGAKNPVKITTAPTATTHNPTAKKEMNIERIVIKNEIRII